MYVVLYLAMACNEVVSETGAGRRLGFDGVNGEAVRYELNEGRPVAGHQHLVGPQPQGQLCFLKETYTSQFSVQQSPFSFFIHSGLLSLID